MASQTTHDDSLVQLKLKIREHDKLAPFYEIFDDPFLLGFLQGKKFQVEVALSCLEKYMNMRTVKYRKEMSPFRPSKVALLDTDFAQMLRHKDPEGRYIAVLNTCTWTPAFCSVAESIAVTHFALDEGLRRYFYLSPDGVVLILNFKDFPLSKMMASFPYLMQTVDLAFKCLPASPKALHFVNENALIHTFLPLFRKVISNKIGGRVHLHSTRLESLHEHVPPNILPKSLGGTLTDAEAYDSHLIAGAKANDAFYDGIWPSHDKGNGVGKH
ncbi:alpha-tocopherol transfer protein-like isoform X1 [Folsomia candida]|uniref:alpha-tocopherol transfer protein-like isoform X1 n=2 Tax=Folsomia candida TaxID=158441 RepID=UPI000B8F34D6|nr:alpha-tocopherol transfer protein-like isoform X1 [Folsomia candida]